MAIFKCKMCGGTLEINDNKTVAECEYCGTKQTLPKLDDERKANLYDRANHFRRNNEFDKAMSIYESILNEDKTDAESYWSIVLCRYGIEYVEDPATHKRVPTVNRAQFTSIFMDEDYKSAIEYADAVQKEVYEAEAKAIDEIQKGILEISQKEEPFDVFICYKETDSNGRRTPDSVLATELYHELQKEGFKVFFARITLEDKLGTAYEPYIFAALNSAKVMVVLGTKQEYFNAVWVKNEWSRYLALIKNGAKKTLIPAYKDMDPYDLPEEFSHLQAQDMTKLGFMQDLVRGIRKITGETEQPTVIKETVVTSATTATNTAPLLKRAFMFLEDGDFARADDFCEQVLNIDPECAEAYLGKLMAELKVRKQDDFKDYEEPFNEHNNYQKAIRFGDEQLVNELKDYIDQIKKRNEEQRLASIYAKAVDKKKAATSEQDFIGASALFKSISEYKDSKELAEKCIEKAEIARKDVILSKAKDAMNGTFAYRYEDAIALFKSVSGWKDADEQILACEEKIKEIEEKEKASKLERDRKAEIEKQTADKRRKINKIIKIIALSVIFVVAIFIIILNTFLIPNGKLKDAMKLIEAEDYDTAYVLIEELRGNDAIKKSKYDMATELFDAKDYDSSFLLFNQIKGYKDVESKREICYVAKYGQEAWNKIKKLEVGGIYTFGSYEQDNDKSNGKENIEWIVLEKRDNKILVISKYALDYQPYNTDNANGTWEGCSLRKWLNNDFIDKAFSEQEKARIPVVALSTDVNSDYRNNWGNDTNDKVFLLSSEEANKYFSSDGERQCEATKVCTIKNASHVDDNNFCWWWLRSYVYDQTLAASVYFDGSILYDGYIHYDSVRVSSDFNAVRPAMWIVF